MNFEFWVRIGPFLTAWALQNSNDTAMIPGEAAFTPTWKQTLTTSNVFINGLATDW